MAAIDAAVLGEGPMPVVLKRYLLATDQFGVGYEVAHRLQGREFLTAWYMQRRLILVSTQEGRQQLETERGLARAIALEDTSHPPEVIDFVTASEDQIRQWEAQQFH